MRLFLVSADVHHACRLRSATAPVRCDARVARRA